MTSSFAGWSDVEISGHRCGIYEPPEPNPNGYVAIYLHGVHEGHLRDHPPFSEQFDRHGLRVIAPVSGPSWWTDRIFAGFDEELSAEKYVVEHVVPYVAARWEVQPPRIGLFGTSMGGQGALRMAFKYPDTFPVVAAIAPAIDYHLKWEEGDAPLQQMYSNSEAARQDTCILHVHPLNWPRNIWFACDPADWRWHDSAERLHMKLASLGIPHEYDLETEAGGHGFEYYCAMAETAMGHLVDRLDRERLRIV